MCFSNLPVEFDEDGDPYLADEADDVGRPETGVVDGEELGDGADANVDAAVDADLAADPEGAYEELVATLSDTARDHLDDGGEPPAQDGEPDPESAEGD